MADSSAAVVPDAQITAANSDTKVEASTRGTADGTFVLAGLPPGTYTVTVAKQGFQSYVTSNLVLHPATVATDNATLAMRRVGTEVSVVAAPAPKQNLLGEDHV